MPQVSQDKVDAVNVMLFRQSDDTGRARRSVSTSPIRLPTADFGITPDEKHDAWHVPQQDLPVTKLISPPPDVPITVPISPGRMSPGRASSGSRLSPVARASSSGRTPSPVGRMTSPGRMSPIGRVLSPGRTSPVGRVISPTRSPSLGGSLSPGRTQSTHWVASGPANRPRWHASPAPDPSVYSFGENAGSLNTSPVMLSSRTDMHGGSPLSRSPSRGSPVRRIPVRQLPATPEVPRSTREVPATREESATSDAPAPLTREIPAPTRVVPCPEPSSPTATEDASPSRRLQRSPSWVSERSLDGSPSRRVHVQLPGVPGGANAKAGQTRRYRLRIPVDSRTGEPQEHEPIFVMEEPEEPTTTTSGSPRMTMESPAGMAMPRLAATLQPVGQADRTTLGRGPEPVGINTGGADQGMYHNV